MNKLLKKFTTFDLVMIALLSASGIAVKPFVRALTQVATGTIIPAGSVSGIIYMLWIVLACSITKKRGTAILVGIVQSILVIVFDMLGNRGVGNLLVYIVPCIIMETAVLPFPNYVSSILSGFFAGMVLNITGSLIVSVVFMRLPLVPVLFGSGVAAVSGGIGGVVGFKLYDSMISMNKSSGLDNKFK